MEKFIGVSINKAKNSDGKKLSANDVQLVVDTVSDLALYDNTTADVILVKDLVRTSGNHFIWNASGKVNNGTVYAGKTGYWQMMYQGPVNVKWFGAIGDGKINDDTLAIQTAIAGFDNIYIPAGIYLTTGLTINRNNVQITGDSSASTPNALNTAQVYDSFATVIKAIPGCSNIITIGIIYTTFPLPNPPLYSSILIQNIILDGNSIASYGLYCSLERSVIKNLVVTGTISPGAGVFHAWGWSNTYDNIWATFNAGDGIVFNQECNNTSLQNSEIDWNGGNGVIVKSGQVFSIIGTGIESNGKNGILFSYQDDVTFRSGKGKPYVDTQVSLVSINNVYLEGNGSLTSGNNNYYNCKIAGASIADFPYLGGINEVTFRGCLFNSPSNSPARACIRIEDYVRNISFDTCEIAFSNGINAKSSFSLSTFILNFQKRITSNIKATNSYIYATPYATIDNTSSVIAQNIGADIAGAVQSATITVSNVSFMIAKKNKTVYIKVNGIASSTINQPIDFNPTYILFGINSSTSNELGLPPSFTLALQRIYGYSLIVDQYPYIIPNIPAGTNINNEVFEFTSYF